MSSFTNALIVEKVKNREWSVYKDFSYDVGYLGSTERITVPAGFTTDLASVPRGFWTILPPDGTYTQACVLHDWICHKRGLVERQYTYVDASKIFREALTVLAVPKRTTVCMYYGVLWFGPRF